MSRKASPLDALWQAPALIWTLLVGEGLAIVLALAPDQSSSRWVDLGLYSLLIQWIALTTLGIAYALRRYLRPLPMPTTAAVLAGLLLLCAWVVGLGAWQLSRQQAGSDAIDAPAFFLRLTVIALTVGLLGLAAFGNYWQSRQSMLRAKQAEMEALQARIRPHFLFNTLNSAAALVREHPLDAERVILDLSDLFRAALTRPGWVALEHELSLCRRYLAIEQARYGDRLEVQWHVAPGLDALSVPLLAIQPLVENAVMHGLDRETGHKTLSIEAAQTAGDLHISVSNPTPGSGARQTPRGHHVGLAGVRARIESITQGAGEMTTQADDLRFVVRLRIPKAAMPDALQEGGGEPGYATIS